MSERTNEQRRELLTELDNSDVCVDKWIANFLESVLSQEYPWTPKQIAKIDEILDQYLPF